MVVAVEVILLMVKVDLEPVVAETVETMDQHIQIQKKETMQQLTLVVAVEVMDGQQDVLQVVLVVQVW